MARSNGRIKELVSMYEENIKANGSSFYMEALDLLDVMDYYLQKGRGYDAETCLRHALRLHPDNEDVLLAQAYALKEEGNIAEGLSLVYALPNQDSRGVKMFLAEYSLMLSDSVAAEEIFQDYWNICSTEDYDVCVEIAELYLDYGYWASSLNWTSKVPSSYMDYLHCQELSAECHYQMGQYEVAIKILESILDVNPYDNVSWAQLAQVQYRIAAYREAIDSCDYALAINATSVDALRIKVQSAIALTQLDMAIECAKEYYVYRPSDYIVFLLLGEALLAKDRLDDASTYLSLAGLQCPHEMAQDSIRIKTLMACVQARRQQYPLVYETLLRTLSLGVSLLDVRLQTAQLCLEQGEREFSLELLSEVLNSSNLQSEQVERVAILLCEHACYLLAKDLWKSLMRLTTEYPNLCPYIALAMYHLKDVAGYKLFLMLACQADPTLTQHLFREIYPGLSAFEYDAAADAEFGE